MAFDALFLDGRAGRLFAVCYLPDSACSREAGLVFVPPFAEEMNRSRRMIALQARELASLGVTVLVLDLYGCGDSAGDFREARWEIWRDDVAVAADWLWQRGVRRVGLWGLRLGGTLAAEVATDSPGRFDRLILWQPVLSGAMMLTQFLRTRIAAAMADPGRGETANGMRADLASGRTLEIAGYELSPELAAAIDAAKLDRLTPPPDLAVTWLEVVPQAGRELSLASRNLIERWRARGNGVEAAIVVAPPFWSLQETTLAPELITATRSVFLRGVD